MLLLVLLLLAPLVLLLSAAPALRFMLVRLRVGEGEGCWLGAADAAEAAGLPGRLLLLPFEATTALVAAATVADEADKGGASVMITSELDREEAVRTVALPVASGFDAADSDADEDAADGAGCCSGIAAAAAAGCGCCCCCC